MSWRVAKECVERRFGSAPRKQIIMFLADKASDDGSGIWCSKGTIQRHTELGASTVKRTIKEFLDEGILIETGQKKRCKNGHTIVYRLILAKVTLLELTREPDLETGFTVDPVQSEPGTQPMVDPVPGPQRTPNNPKTIHKPPPRKREVADGLEAEKILAAYPSDRLREKQACLPQIEDALNRGIAAEELLLAVQAYATESAGFTRSRVCFSDNWFQTRRWQGYIEDMGVHHVTYSPETGLHKQVGFFWAPSWTIEGLVLLPLFLIVMTQLLKFWRDERTSLLKVGNLGELDNDGWMRKVESFSIAFWAIFLACLLIVCVLQWTATYFSALMQGAAKNAMIDWILVAVEGLGLPAASRPRGLHWLRKSAAQNNEGAIKALRRRGY